MIATGNSSRPAALHGYPDLSNLKGFFEISGHNAAKINRWMAALKEMGRFEAMQTRQAMERFIAADFASEKETLSAIREVFAGAGYLLIRTPLSVSRFTGSTRPQRAIGPKPSFCATASPFKFSSSVLQAIKDRDYLEGKDEFAMRELSRLSGNPGIPGSGVWRAGRSAPTVCERSEISSLQENPGLLQLLLLYRSIISSLRPTGSLQEDMLNEQVHPPPSF